jgi:hypothetical protein
VLQCTPHIAIIKEKKLKTHQGREQSKKWLEKFKNRNFKGGLEIISVSKNEVKTKLF